jgi:hypothetical protein
METNRIYKSKVDLWLFLIVIIGCVFLAGAAIQTLFSEGLNHPGTLTLLASTLFYMAVMFGLAYPVTYEITQSELIIRSGLTRNSIELSSIESVKSSRNPLSSPAWSLDRLRIDYHRKGKLTFLLISPEDRTAFLNDLILKTNGLSLQGDKVASLSKP